MGIISLSRIFQTILNTKFNIFYVADELVAEICNVYIEKCSMSFSKKSLAAGEKNGFFFSIISSPESIRGERGRKQSGLSFEVFAILFFIDCLAETD